MIMNKLFLIIIISILICNISECEAKQLIIEDVRGEIFDENAEIIIEANGDIEYLDYTLQNPPRIIIDPIGKVYTDLKDVISFDHGPVKMVKVVRGREESGLTGDFYPLDFISIEVNKLPSYKVTKEIKRELIVINIEGEKRVDLSEVVPPVIETRKVEYATKKSSFEPEDRIVVPRPKKKKVKKKAPRRSREEEEKRAKEAERIALMLDEIDRKKDEIIPLEEEELSVPVELPVMPIELPIAQETGSQEPQIIPLDEPKGSDSGIEIPVMPDPNKMVYEIGEGDELDISVWRHSELDKVVMVRPDGNISFPLVGDVKAAGLSPTRVSSSIKKGLSRLIKDPRVTVIVSGIGSKNIFVLGEVNKPGSYSFRGGMSVLDAISQSGGWKNSAVLNSVILVRKAFTEAPEAHRLNVYALVKKGDFSQNMSLNPGDVVYIPKSFIANIGGFIENLKIKVGASVNQELFIFER